MSNEESKCPVPHGPATGGGTSNQDWWPNQLNLKILSQHSSKVDPMGEAFDAALSDDEVLEAADVASLQGNADLQVMEQQGLNVGYLAYNTQMAPFDDVRVHPESGDSNAYYTYRIRKGDMEAGWAEADVIVEDSDLGDGWVLGGRESHMSIQGSTFGALVAEARLPLAGTVEGGH